MASAPRIAVIGGGFTGAAAAIALLRNVNRSFDLAIFEPNAELGRGLAYGKAAPFHLLNVRAGKLGIDPLQPTDFASWARDRSFGIRRPRPDQPEPTRAFLPRSLYGAYVDDRLQEALADRPDVRFSHVMSAATGIRRVRSGYRIEFSDRDSLTFHSVILATGYGIAPANNRFGRDLFADVDSAEARNARSALFIGTGLTFIDQFLLLRSLGFRGESLAISRRGLLPEVHRVDEAPRPMMTRRKKPALLEFMAAFRRTMRASEPPAAAAVDLVLGLRERLQPLWRALEEAEQRRFLRHLRPYWNVARHRVAPEIHAQLRHAMKTGAVAVTSGRVLAPDGESVRLLPRGGEAFERRFDLVFDCTGFRPDIRNPVIQSLIRQNLAKPDAHGLGIAVRSNGEVLSREGGHSAGLFALGPLGHGTLFEITAVPEIVEQATRMAESLSAHLGGAAGAILIHRPNLPDYPGMVG